MAEDGSGGPAVSFDALRVPFVRPFVLARMAATMGTQFVSFAVGWELYERTHDPWSLGLVGLAQAAPVLLLMVPAGNLADRLPRRNLAMVAHSLMALAALGLGAVSWSAGPVELVYGLLILAGAGRALAAPSVNTLLAQLLKPSQFGNAYAWLVSTGQLANVSGPAVGGLLIAQTGAAAWTYLAAAGGQFVFVSLLATLPAIRPTSGGRTGWRELFAGAAFIRRSRVYFSAITLDLFAVLLGGAVALLPVYARDILQIGPDGLGLLRSAPALGAATAALAATRLPPWQRPGRVLLLMVACFGLATIGFGLSRSLPISLACLVCIGAFDSISMVIRGTLQQVITPDRLRGRVAAIHSLFTNLSNELGAFESGAAAALFGPVVAVVAGGIGTLAVVAGVATLAPELVRIGPLHTLRPPEPAQERAASGQPAASPP